MLRSAGRRITTEPGLILALAVCKGMPCGGICCPFFIPAIRCSILVAEPVKMPSIWRDSVLECSAIDASPAMVRIAQSRGVSAEIGSIERIHTLDGVFDGVISNFGALNCVPQLSALRSPLARLIRPGGYLAICLMGRFCLGESLHFIRKIGNSAARRWKGQTYAKRLDLPVYYPFANTVLRALTGGFPSGEPPLALALRYLRPVLRIFRRRRCALADDSTHVPPRGRFCGLWPTTSYSFFAADKH